MNFEILSSDFLHLIIKINSRNLHNKIKTYTNI